MTASPKLESSTIINDVLDSSPKLAEIFTVQGMACVGCVFSRFHSLAEAAAIYHLDIDQLINQLSQETAIWSDNAPSDAENL